MTTPSPADDRLRRRNRRLSRRIDGRPGPRANRASHVADVPAGPGDNPLGARALAAGEVGTGTDVGMNVGQDFRTGTSDRLELAMRVAQKLVDFGECRRKAAQVERDPSNERLAIRFV